MEEPLSPELVKEYNKHRQFGPKPVLCYAPFKSMYFDLNGRVGACGLSFKEYDRYPVRTIKEIWNGDKFNKHRNLILKNDLSYEFNVCKTHIQNKNFHSAKAIWYDNLSLDENFPVMMEFELDNTCNLECIMCNATKSSAIRRRKNIEQPFKNPYDSNFVEQLKEFIPHLEKAIFIGGEPFLINIYYEIWEQMSMLNPGMVINVNTNCTVLSDNIKAVLEKSNFELNLSIDSLNKTTYERIRKNAVFEKTIENLHYFKDYCERKNTRLYMCPCPMKLNWEEIPDFVSFCNELNTTLFLYTLFQPYELALWSFHSSRLREILDRFEKNDFPSNTEIEKHNRIEFESFLIQVHTWFDDAVKRENKEYYRTVPSNFSERIEKFLDKISNSLKVAGESYDLKKLDLYHSSLSKLVQILPPDIDRDILFDKLEVIDVSIIMEQLDINDENQLIDNAKMLYYSSYLT